MFTIKEVAAELKISARTVWKMIRAGEIQSARIGKQYRIPANELARLKMPTQSK